MAPKRRRSSVEDSPISKKLRTRDPKDTLSSLTDELLIRVLHHLPISTLLSCQLLSHRFYRLAGDSQIWKSLYYSRFVLPRALRIPGIKTSQTLDNDLHFASRRSKWLDEGTLVQRKDGKKTNWKSQYKLRHNWSIGACEVQEIHVSDRPSVPAMLVRLAEGIVLTADKEEGLRAWDLKEKKLIAKCGLEEGSVPTCLAVDEQQESGLGIAVGFMNGGWGTWGLDVKEKVFTERYRHPKSSNGMLSAVAYAEPYILTITDAQLLSLYTFDPKAPEHPPPDENEDGSRQEENPPEEEQGPTDSAPPPQEEELQTESEPPLKDPSPLAPSPDTHLPTLLASLKSHTSWPPLSLSIRSTPTTLIASIAYSLPTYLSGYTIGLQELHLYLLSGQITFSRLASALPAGFTSLSPSSHHSSSSMLSSPSSSGTSTPLPSSHSSSTMEGRGNTRPTTLSYSHPYILATHPDNTLTLYLCQSTPSTLSISPGTKLWGHTSSVSSAEITPRGKAVSVSLRGGELRVWELEGGSSSSSRKRISSLSKMADRFSERSVRIRPESKDQEHRPGGEVDVGDNLGEGWGGNGNGSGMEIEARKQWVGFDDEVVIVLKESGEGTQALMVYDFT